MKGLAACHGASITACIGSNVADQLKVLERKRVQPGDPDPNANVSAILSMNVLKQRLEAVVEGRFLGRSILYPQLTLLSLTPIERLSDISGDLAHEVVANGLGRKAGRV